MKRSLYSQRWPIASITRWEDWRGDFYKNCLTLKGDAVPPKRGAPNAQNNVKMTFFVTFFILVGEQGHYQILKCGNRQRKI